MTPDEAEAWGVSRLRGVVERLEPKVGGINHLAAERGSNEGLMHLWFALHHAREALVAGIADQTLVAQVLELERAGLEKARAYQASKRGRSGARVTAPRNQAS